MDKYDEIAIHESITSWTRLQEGLWDKIKKFFISGDPNDPHIDSAVSQFYREQRSCQKYFPHSGSQIKIPTGREREDGTLEKFELNTFKENPKQVQCILEARYKLTKFMVEYIKKHGVEKICQNHEYPDKCHSFIRGEFNYAVRGLRDAEYELKMIEKHGLKDSKTQWDVKFNRLKQLK